MLPRRTHEPKKSEYDEAKPCWMEVLQGAVDSLIPSDERLEAFLDRYERMP